MTVGVGLSKDAEAEGAVGTSPLSSVVGFMLSMTRVWIYDDLNRRMRRLNLRPSDYSVMTIIRHHPMCRASQVAEALSIKRPNFVVLLAALEERELVSRQRSSSDRRVFHLQVTQKGLVLLEKADLVVEEQEQQIQDLLGKDGKADLVDLLSRLKGLAPQRDDIDEPSGDDASPTIIKASSASAPRG